MRQLLVMIDWATQAWIFEIVLIDNDKYKLQLNSEIPIKVIRRFITSKCLDGMRAKGREEAQLLSMIETAMCCSSLSSVMLSANDVPLWAQFAAKLEGSRSDELERKLRSKRAGSKDGR